AGAIVKANSVEYRLIEWRHLIRAEVSGSKQAVDRAGRYARQELAFRIGPPVFFRAGDVNPAGRAQRGQFGRIDRKLIDMVRIFAVVFAEPVGKPVNQVADSFTVVAPRQRSAAFARAAREHHRKALIYCSGPKDSLTQPRVAQDGNALCIDVFVLFQVIHRPAQAICPGTDSAPVISRRLSLSRLEKHRPDTVLIAALKIGLNVLVTDRSQRISAGQNLLNVEILAAPT